MHFSRTGALIWFNKSRIAALAQKCGADGAVLLQKTEYIAQNGEGTFGVFLFPVRLQDGEKIGKNFAVGLVQQICNIVIMNVKSRAVDAGRVQQARGR